MTGHYCYSGAKFRVVNRLREKDPPLMQIRSEQIWPYEREKFKIDTLKYQKYDNYGKRCNNGADRVFNK